MPNLYILRGIPGSGKSTIALEYAKNNNAYIVSFDSLRSMLAGEEDYSRIYTNFTNSIVADLADTAVMELFYSRKNIIIDNTDIRISEINHWLSLCPESYSVTIITVSASIETCLKRSKNRKKIVPEDAIWRMHCTFSQIDLSKYQNEKFPVINFITYNT